MTKPLPTGCIKQNSDISWRTFNLLMQNLSLDNNIGHLYVVDIEFDHTKATENQIVNNKIYPPMIEKQQIIDSCERQCINYLNNIQQLKKGNPRTYRATKKAHATTFKKKFEPMYLEQILFAVNRVGWHVKSIHVTHLNMNVFKKTLF